MARCINSGHISGGTNGWGDSIGTAGIAAVASNGVTIEDVCNVGAVESTTDSCGGLVAVLEGKLYRGVNYSGCRTVGDAGSAILRDIYSMYDDGVALAYPVGFYTGELAWRLNTDNGTVENRGVWSQDGEYPILPSDSIAVRQPSAADIIEAVNVIGSRRPDANNEIILFDLNNNNINRFKRKDYEKILNM